MNKNKKTNLFYFLLSFFISLCLCGTLAIPLLITKNEKAQTVDTPYFSAPYKNIKTDIFLVLVDSPLDFYIEINTASKSCSVSGCPKNAVKRSNEFLNKNATPEEKARFLNKNCDRSITITTQSLITITDFLGGIVCDTPYGFPSPSREKTSIALDENLLIYGNSAMSLITAETFPDSNRISFCAKIISLIVQKFLQRADMESYVLLSNLADTDISYADYYDNRTIISAAGENIKSFAFNGFWMNEKFYLY